METGSIYCVDDDEDILLLYQIVLGQAGHTVSKIASGGEALTAIDERKPDLIILDEKMSDYSGMEICRRIRSDPTLSYIPIIMVTGVDSREGKIRSLESGIDDYILKPFDHEELLAKVQVMLRIKRLYSDLLQTRQELFKAEKLAAVGQLAAAMAHEIRNPLSIIGASVQFLKNQLQDRAEERSMMDTILRKISEIDGTIRELLAVARPLKLKRQLVDLNECVREVVGFIKEKCIVQKVNMSFHLPDDLPFMMGDEEHLQRALLNVLINALNSMPQGGELKIRTYEENAWVHITVEDTGNGIASGDIQHVFEPFFSRHAGGSGLGLFVVKMIVDELNGRIQVDSALQKGTCLTMAWPASKGEKIFKPMEGIPDNTINPERGERA